MRADGAKYHRNTAHPDAWAWAPTLKVYDASLESMDTLIGANWECAGVYREITSGVAFLFGQLEDMRLVGPPDTPPTDREVWTPLAAIRRVEACPVTLAFTLSPAEERQAKGTTLQTRQMAPPANLGELGLIIGTRGDKIGWIRCPITRLPPESQQLQKDMGEALTRLAAAPYNLERSAWLEQWKELQAMARNLAADYWRTYQELQAEPPAPINIWTLGKAEAALAAMTAFQDGAHASINNKDGWEPGHMIQNGTYQGLVVGSYTHGTEHTTNVIWMEPPKDPDVPADPNTPIDLDLVSQEVLRQQAKLSDMDADLVTLVPIYLLTRAEDEVYLSPEQLLKDLSFTPVHNQAGYGNTYTPDEMRRVVDAFERLAWIKIKTNQFIQRGRGRKPALVTDEAPYLAVMGRRWQAPLDGFGPRRFLGWKYRVPWLKNFTSDTEAGKQLGILLKKSFAYHSDKQRWEKRLARYLTIHLNVAAHHRQSGMNRIIRDVMEQCGLAPTQNDRDHPGAYADQFEKAMNTLKKDGIIGDWKSKLDRHAKGFPARKWFDLWLDSSFHVTQPPTALKFGYQKMIDTRQAGQEKKK